MPVYNEEKTIAEVVKKVCDVEYNFPAELIIINDGSHNGTANILKSIPSRLNAVEIKIINHEKNRGKGASIRTGIENSNGNIITIQDADTEYDPSEFISLCQNLRQKNEKIIYASRFYPNSKSQSRFFQYISNRLLTTLFNFLYNTRMTDIETCHKIFDANVLKSLNLKTDRFEIEAEITAKAVKAGYKIIEVPIKFFKARSYKEGKKIGLADGIRSVIVLLKIRFLEK